MRRLSLKRLTGLTDLIPTRTVLLTICGIIVIHLVALLFYTQQHRVTSRLASRDIAIQKVLNIIHMIRATPKTELEKAISTLRVPDVVLSIATEPKYKSKFRRLSYWSINHLIPKRAGEIKLSLQLRNGKWLNIEEAIHTETYWMQLSLLLLELIILATIVFYTWSISRFTRPLKLFREAADRLGVDVNSSTQLTEYQGPQIVRETAQAMNKMQQRISDLLKDRTSMLAAISHDLRTPITRLKLRAAMMENKDLEYKTIQDLDEMDSMIGDILAFARNDYAIEEKTTIDLNSLLQSLCDDLSDVGSNVSYSSENRRVPFLARRLTLKRALSNLIHNAMKYGDAAFVYLKETENKTIVVIEDDGPGIPDAELEAVFTPFYRCDRSRNRNIAGTGLGLALARDAIRAHGGDVTLTNRKNGGLCATIMLKKL